MKSKTCLYIVLLFISLLLLSSCSSKTDSMNDKLIRFHVIANSDSEEDQNLKLKIRDDVLKAIGPKLEKSRTKAESEDIITQNIDTIKEIAKKRISKSGKSYEVDVALTNSSFPTKSYSGIALPAGEYEALKITVGEGEGKNWWCVMFPPLCYVDITRGITTKDTEGRLKTVLNENEYDSILESNSKNINEPVKKPLDNGNGSMNYKFYDEEDTIEIKFKSVELAKSFMSKIEGILDKK